MTKESEKTVEKSEEVLYNGVQWKKRCFSNGRI